VARAVAHKGEKQAFLVFFYSQRRGKPFKAERFGSGKLFFFSFVFLSWFSYLPLQHFTTTIQFCFS